MNKMKRSSFKDLDIDRMNAELPKETTEERYREMLEVLPPRAMTKGGFLVGEPVDHEGLDNQARYDMFTCVKNKYLERGPKTVAEFKQIMQNMKEIDKIFA